MYLSKTIPVISVVFSALALGIFLLQDTQRLGPGPVIDDQLANQDHQQPDCQHDADAGSDPDCLDEELHGSVWKDSSHLYDDDGAC